MRILFDTNVLISAFVTRGHSSEVFDHCLSEHMIYISPWILNEVQRTLTRKFRFPVNKTQQITRFIKGHCQVIRPRPLTKRVCRDADDDNVLAAALHAKADFIVTGDTDLLVLKSFRGIQIVSPSDFWKFESQRD